MSKGFSRRDFLAGSLGTLSGLLAVPGLVGGEVPDKPGKGNLRLGLVTYLLAKDWDIETIIKNCSATGFEAVELRTTHAHGVEVTLSKAQRREVKRRFEDSPVNLASLGSAFQYHSTDPAEVRRNIEGTKEYVKLAYDVGAEGVKVRPNGLQTRKGVPVQKTLEQIGKALHECGEFAKDYGIQIRVEVHGPGTSRIPNMKTIMDEAASDNVFICWNSNKTDLEDGGFEANFKLLKDKIAFVHMHELYDENYPYRRLFELLVESGYNGYCCAEIPQSDDPVRVMKYYRGMFLALQNKL